MANIESKKFILFAFFLAFVIAGSFALKINHSFAETPEEIKSSIDKKAEELKQVSNQIRETQQQIDATQKQAKTLKNEISTINYKVNQINLGIKSSGINIQKMGLELESLNYDIQDTEKSIGNKKDAIAHFLRELQRKDGESFLTIFLKNQSLAESISEIQSLNQLNGELNNQIKELRSLQDTLNQKLDAVSNKKQDLEIENKNLKVKKEIAADQKKEKDEILKQTKNKESIYQKQLSDLEKQQYAISDEITKMEDQLRSGFDLNILPGRRAGVLAWPIQMVSMGGTGHLTQHYGERSYLYRGKPHNGMDIGTPIGTPVYAAADGVVMAVDNNDRGYYQKYQYGRYVLIRHGNNMTTIYAHLSRQAAQVGRIVKRGDVIGYSGNTGYSIGPHLHFGLYWAPTVTMKSIPPASGLVPIGIVMNPEDYL